MENSIPIAIIGATGAVGQKAVCLADAHPKFHIAELAASDAREGIPFNQAVHWREAAPLNPAIGNLPLKSVSSLTSPYVISALPASVAREVEPALLENGHHVFSNASTFRLKPNVPILIPEVNLSHLCLLREQSTPGKLVTNSNCCVAFIAAALAPLMALAPLSHAHIVTLQALSGAGYPGVSALDVCANVVPFISGEEEKIGAETLKILGEPHGPARFSITASVHRVPVLHGHLMALHLVFAEKVNPQAALEAYERWNVRFPGLFALHTQPHDPQPARHLTDHDYRVHLGRIRRGGEDRVLCLEVLGHNLVRGAAGAALSNLEATVDHLSSRLASR